MNKYQCTLYNCKSINKLSKLLYCKNKTELLNINKSIIQNPYLFFKPFIKSNRELFVCNNKIKQIHQRLNKLFNVDIPPYLKSAVKKQSHITNVQTHQLSNFFLLVDIKSFYPSTTKTKIKNQLIKTYHQSSKVADVISNLVTVPQKKSNDKRALVTGSVLSQYFAFVINKKMFDELYELSKKEDILFSVYVDDITFSSKQIIPYKFHQTIYNIIKKYGYKIHQGKIYRGNIGNKSTITGIHITKYGFRLMEKHKIEIRKLMKSNDYKQNKSLAGLVNYAIQVNPKYSKIKYLITK